MNPLMGQSITKKLSADIRKELPDATGISPTSLHYMRWFYDRYSPLFENLRQLAVEFDSDATNLTKVRGIVTRNKTFGRNQHMRDGQDKWQGE